MITEVLLTVSISTSFAQKNTFVILSCNRTRVRYYPESFCFVKKESRTEKTGAIKVFSCFLCYHLLCSNEMSSVNKATDSLNESTPIKFGTRRQKPWCKKFANASEPNNRGRETNRLLLALQ